MTWLRVLGPNLGAPLLLEGDRPELEILAVWPGPGLPDGEALRDAFRLETAQAHGRVCGKAIRSVPLEPAGPPEPLTDWQSPARIRDASDTRKLLPKAILEYLPAGRLELFTLRLRPAEPLLAEDEPWLLYDLVARCRWSEAGPGAFQRCRHAVQVMPADGPPPRFLHLTDLHLARRNDEMLSQVSSRAEGRSLAEIRETFRNFNENVRTALARANELALAGELDFVVITGDLVDFAHFDWEDGPCRTGTNWDVFLEVLTGGGAGQDRGNPGLGLACFVTLGNHDWRLHPYLVRNYAKQLGLEEKEAEAVFVPTLDPSSPDLSRRRRAWDLAEITLLTQGRRLRAARWLQSRVYKVGYWFALGLVVLLAAVGLWRTPSSGVAALLTRSALPGVGGTVAVVLVGFLGLWLGRRYRAYLVDSPLHASVHGLYRYFLEVSPYLELAFSFRGHWFLLLDTGPDVFTGQLLDGKTVRRLKRISLQDNILGGSPDSRGLVSDRVHRDWGQVQWLERMLAARAERAPQGRCFVFVHAPPVNTDKGPKVLAQHAESQREGRGEDPWVPRKKVNLTYGTMAHHLSQFFYLCLGGTEADLRDRPGAKPSQPTVDLILCGHAHRNVEFRLGLTETNQVGIATDNYSARLQDIPEAERPAWWALNRPIVAQTAGAGPPGSSAPDPPYGRLVRLDESGLVADFSVRCLAED